MQGIAFFDIEVVLQPKERIGSIGLYLDGKTRHTTSVHDFEQYAAGADCLCGHNIFAHDLPYLEKAGISAGFLRRPFIDTLYLSPLLFPNKPYHRLVKDYQLMSQHLNNPVEDSKLTKDLLAECLEAFFALPAALQTIFCKLLGKEIEFAAFVRLLKSTAVAPSEPDSLQQEIRAFFQDAICENADLDYLIQYRAIQLAYALALVQAPDDGSVIPPWLLFRYPEVSWVLHQIRAKDCGQPSCSYCVDKLSPLAGLRRYYGYEGFRKFSEKETVPLQQEVVEAALREESLLAVFPTGGGKSLSFQLPALMKGVANRGLTVVISPLQALMKDQVDVLRNRFEVGSAVAINGLLSPLERADALQKVREGGVSLLYISPESLRSNTIRKLLKGRHIERFVIDEAHCFSTWGQDFRVDYLYIARFLRELGEEKLLKTPIPVSCFTATAKPEVVQDILQYFREQAKLGLKLYQTSAERKNLQYYAAKAEGQEVKLQHLSGLLQEVSEPAIVYVSRTKTAVQLAEKLQRSGIKASAYHGRMEPEEKIRSQNSFMEGETNVIVATSAFGMGVDKENVKMVVHYDAPDSLENYLQEAGRAGRKADLQAHCHLLFDENDLNEHFALLNQTKLSKKEVGQIWKAVKDFKRSKFTKSALEIAKQAGWETDIRDLETQVKAAVAALEDVGYIKREQNSPRIFAQSILVRNVEEANQVIRSNPQLFPGEQEEQAIRIFQYLISREDTMVDYLADDLGIERERVVRLLLQLKDLGLLGDSRDLTAFIRPGRGDKNSERYLENYARLEQALLETLQPLEEAPPTLRVYLRDINEKLLSSGCTGSSIDALRSILQYWEHQHYIRKERLDAQTYFYKIAFREERKALHARIKSRTGLATEVVRWLSKQNALQLANKQKREEGALSFSMMEMKQQLGNNHLFLAKTPLVEYEASLLYLHFIGAIKLEGGLFVLYNPMTIVRLEKNPLKQYTKEDYAKLERHYEKKVEQIHIMGEYARKQLRSHLEAVSFVNDYFSLSYEDFVNRHFKGQKGKLKQPITDKKFRDIFGSLSIEQMAVVKDKSENILVGAGPGSGKTRVLVHKVAALLMMEDIKPEQFLMLTFSRPAAQEFKERLFQLIGKSAYHIDIFTYHGFAFQLLGRVGDLKKSDNVIQQTTEALRQEDISTERIKCKSVIVVDEYQDVNQQEYDFLQVITALADEVRMIVVGDDDQNVYEFRGSSVAYMRRFLKERQAKKFLLSTNYRACFNLVEFSNQFLSLFQSDRLKADFPLRAYKQKNGVIQLREYSSSSNLVTPLVQDILSRKLSGTIAVLTHTNEEALLAQNLLRQNGVPARLISSQEGFSLKQLLELKCFSLYIHEEVSNEFGFIPPASWENCLLRMEQLFSASVDLPLALEVIKAFEREKGERRFWSDWLAFLSEVRVEDFVYPEAKKVLISTMHKAKGKEFDHVFLLLQNYPLLGEDRKRVVYVAMTRARQSLFIHTDQKYFHGFSVPQMQITQDGEVYPSPESLQLELGMQDVYLGFFRQPDSGRRVKKLVAGSLLRLAAGPVEGLLSEEGFYVLKFSHKFKEKLPRLFSQGYTLSHAEVNHLVVWYCEDDGKEYRVVLPRIFLKRINQNKQATMIMK